MLIEKERTGKRETDGEEILRGRDMGSELKYK